MQEFFLLFLTSQPVANKHKNIAQESFQIFKCNGYSLVYPEILTGGRRDRRQNKKNCDVILGTFFGDVMVIMLLK